MYTIGSVISTVILDVINVLLIDYLFSSFFEKKTDRKLYCGIVISLYLFTHLNYFNGYSVLMLDVLVMILMSYSYIASFKEKTLILFISTVLISIVEILVYQFFISVFNCNISIRGDFHNDILMIFKSILTRYILYLILHYVLYKKNLIDDMKAKTFKYISLGVSIFYGIAIVIFFYELLFYHHTVGRIFVFTLILYNLVLIVFNRYENMHLRTLHELDVMKRNRGYQEKYWNDYTESYQWIRKTKHDMKSSYICLRELIKDGKYEDAIESIESKVDNLKDMDYLVYFGNPRIDAVLSKKKRDALELGIDIKYNLGIVSIGDIDEEDIGILFANALDNAIEATVGSSYNTINVEVFINGGYLCIKVINYVDDIDKVSFDRTSKVIDKENHGIGIRSMKECAKKYHGYLKYVKEENRVILMVNLYVG